MKQRWMLYAVALMPLVAGSLTAQAGSIPSSSVWGAVRSQAKPDIQPAWGYYRPYWGYGGYYRPYDRGYYGGYYHPYYRGYYGGYYRPYYRGYYGGY